MSEVNLPLPFVFWEESDETTHFFVHVSLLILCWEGIAEQFGQAAPPLIWDLFLITNCLGMITQIKRHQTFWITTNLPRKTKVPFSKVIIRQFF